MKARLSNAVVSRGAEHLRRHVWTAALVAVVAGAACYVGPTESDPVTTAGGTTDPTSGGVAQDAGGAPGAPGGGPNEERPNAAASDLPCEVKSLLEAHCAECHGTPLRSPMALVSYEDLTKPSYVDAAKSFAARALARMDDETRPMPPAPAPRVPAGARAAFRAWLERGAPRERCDLQGPDGGGGTADAATDAAPLDDGAAPVPPDAGPPPPTSVCTSGVIWSGRRGPDMQPGRACISCHLANSDDGPIVQVGGTVYPTLNEPDRCEGVRGGAVVVVTDATGRTEELPVGNTGNFSLRASAPALQPPLRVKVVAGGRERPMYGSPPTGDCNSCHTEFGKNGAPGRILLP